MSGYSCIMIFPRSGKILTMHVPDGGVRAQIRLYQRRAFVDRRAQSVRNARMCLLSYGPFSLVRPLRICIKITAPRLRHTGRLTAHSPNVTSPPSTSNLHSLSPVVVGFFSTLMQIGKRTDISMIGSHGTIARLILQLLILKKKKKM